MKPQTYKKNLIVPLASSHVGLALIQHLFGEAAFSHAQLLGYGDEVMNAQHLIWVVSRLCVEITALPNPGESVWIETWPNPHDLLGVKRQYVMTDSQGKPLCQGEALWCVLDKDSGRLMRTQGLTFLADDAWLRQDTASELVHTTRLVKPLLENTRQTSVVPTDADIDKNDHVNNVVYTDWILQSIALKKPRIYRINFLHQVRLGDTIQLEIIESSTSVYVSGVILAPDAFPTAFVASIEL